MWGEGMLDLLVPLKGGFVFSVPHFVVLVRGVVQAAELLNSQKCKSPSVLWPPLRPFLCPYSKSLSTQQLPSKTLIQSRPSQYRPVRESFCSLIQSTLLSTDLSPSQIPFAHWSPRCGSFFSLCLVLLPRPSPSGLSSQVTWKIPSTPNPSLLTL